MKLPPALATSEEWSAIAKFAARAHSMSPPLSEVSLSAPTIFFHSRSFVHSSSPILSSFLNFARSVVRCQCQTAKRKASLLNWLLSVRSLFRSSPVLLSKISLEKSRMLLPQEDVQLQRQYQLSYPNLTRFMTEQHASCHIRYK